MRCVDTVDMSFEQAQYVPGGKVPACVVRCDSPHDRIISRLVENRGERGHVVRLERARELQWYAVGCR